MSLFTELKGCLMIAPKNDIRYYLNAVRVSSAGLFSTDGCMILRINTDINIGDKIFIICRHDLAKKIKLFTKKDEVSLISKGDDLFLNEYKLELVDGNYPDIDRAINSSFSDTVEHKELGVNLSYLSELSKAVSVALDSKVNCAKLTMYERSASLNYDHVFGGLMATRL